MKRNAAAEKLIPELADFADALAAFEREFGVTTTHEIDVTCPLCGQRELWHSKLPDAPAAIMAVCERCSER